jgi:hypothetical protein
MLRKGMTQEGSAMSSSRATRAPTVDAVWPVAALFGAISAASASLGAWLAAWAAGLERPWSVLDWVAEHALWGTCLGALLALVVRLGARADPALRDAACRRAAGARLAGTCVALTLAAVTGAVAGSQPLAWARSLPVLAGAWGALLLAWILLGRGIAGRARFGALPSLDPARVAVLIALLTLPLAPGVRHAPLLGGADGTGSPSAQASLVGRAAPPAEAPETVLEAWRALLGG